MNLNKSIDFNDRMSSTYNKYDTQSRISEISSPFGAAMQAAKKSQLENHPLLEIMQEEGKNLSPSQVAKEMLYNCKVFRRKDFTV